jgi:hypothetical protein
MKIIIPGKQRKESFESECSTADSSGNSHFEEILSQSSSEFNATLSPRSRLMRELVTDYGVSIDSYLRKIEKDSQLNSDHLKNHDLKASFRARMIDWMVEVLNIAFSNICGDQTFFLAVSLMDRYI